MKKLFLAFALFGVSGCILRAMLEPKEPTPQAQAVQIVAVEPKGCRFIASVTGDQNGGEPNRFLLEDQISAEVALNLKNNAARLGGNVVYLQSAYMGRPDISDDYASPFYINGVQYQGQVYACP